MLDSDLFVKPKELLEVKRVQIRAGRANEAVLVKRLSERLQRDLDRQGVFIFIFVCFYIHFDISFMRTGKGGKYDLNEILFWTF